MHWQGWQENISVVKRVWGGQGGAGRGRAGLPSRPHTTGIDVDSYAIGPVGQAAGSAGGVTGSCGACRSSVGW